MRSDEIFEGDGRTVPAAMLDERGRCCGRKPLVYKRDGHRFCCRCDRNYGLTAPEQIENWAWKRRGDGFVKVYPERRRG